MDPQTAGTWIGGAVLALAAAWNHVRAAQADKRAEAAKITAVEATTKATELSASVGNAAASDLARSNAELATAYKRQAEEWKALHEKTHKEHQDYRQWVHDKAKDDQAALLTLTAENADLKARTDLTPLLSHMKQYDLNAQKMTETLENLTKVVTTLAKHIAPDTTLGEDKS